MLARSAGRRAGYVRRDALTGAGPRARGLPHLPVYLGYLDQESTPYRSFEELIASR